MQMTPPATACAQRSWVLLALTIAILFPTAADGFIVGAFRRIETDFRSLTRRVTARHILVQDETVARVLKQKIRDECLRKDVWVTDVFEAAASKYSRDDTTNTCGGLIGELVPQGYCKSPELDRYLFSVALGQIVGPLETEYGYHLVLVSERTNCPKLDGENTQLMQTRGDDVFGTLVRGKQEGTVDLPTILGDQIQFWGFAVVAGGVLAELSEKLVSSL